uniref:Uncharacterized protein n=1 Tax=Knipowitschia caucasica TaxID=637954 RepID=A0AAV2J2Z7_KNICA
MPGPFVQRGPLPRAQCSQAKSDLGNSALLGHLHQSKAMKRYLPSAPELFLQALCCAQGKSAEHEEGGRQEALGVGLVGVTVETVWSRLVTGRRLFALVGQSRNVFS